MSPRIETLSLIVALVLLALSLLHVYWMAGGRWGAEAVVPMTEGQPLFVPGPGGTFVVAVLLAFAAQFIAQRGGSGPALMPAWMAHAGTWVIGIVFLLRAIGDFRYAGFFKRVRGSCFAELDTKYFSPLVLVLGICAVVIAMA